MATESLRMSVVLSASPADVYRAWLDAKEHGAFTGSPAEVNPVIGGRHSAWDGYITGQNLELDPARRIVQSWRTTEFPPEAADSRLRLTLNAVEEGTELLIEHGASEVWALATHAVLSGPAIDRIKNSSITRMVLTNTVPLPPEKRLDKIEVVSIAPIIANAIEAVFQDSSVSEIFDGENQS